jgi:hypothetical protein
MYYPCRQVQSLINVNSFGPALERSCSIHQFSFDGFTELVDEYATWSLADKHEHF